MPVSTKTSGPYSLTRPPRNDDELYELVQTLWGATIPRHKVCPDHQAPFDWFADSFFARAPQTLVHGSRGLSGKSYAMAALGMTQAVVLGSDVNLLGGSFAQSANLHEHMREYWEHPGAPRYMVEDESNVKVQLTNRAKIKPLTASQRTVRGPHPARLLLDEIDEMDYSILTAALGQPLPQKNWMGVKIPAQTAMASTWQNTDGTFAKEYKRFQEMGHPVYTWCYKDSANPIDGWLDQETIDQKRSEIPSEMWRVEYDLGEPSIGNRAIDSEAVEDMFKQDPPKPVKYSKEYEEYKIADYNALDDYVIAADWAKSQDFTVITVWRATAVPAELVYYIRVNRRPYPYMVGLFNSLQKKYSADGIHDATGLGGVVSDYLEGKAYGFMMTGRARDDMLSEYVSAVEKGMVKAPRIPSMYTAHKYARVEDLYSRAQEYHLPDEVCSAALAWNLISRRVPASEPYGSPRATNNWMEKQFERNEQQIVTRSEWRLDGEVRMREEVSEWGMT